MGQRASRIRRSSSRPQHGDPTTAAGGGGKMKPSFLLMDFTQRWLGGGLPTQPVARLPSSWDELLDWTEDAEKLSVSISSHVHPHHQGDVATSSEDHSVVRIVPLVQQPDKQRLDSLPTIPPIEQAIFFAESVVVKFEMKAPDAEARLLSVKQLAEYYKLVRRLSDLLTLEGCTDVEGDDNDDEAQGLGRASPTLGPNAKLTECVICCTETSNSILPCDHRICETCERRWVRKRLMCPFCRTKFRSVREIRNCAWHLSEFSETALRIDLDHLHGQLALFWKTCGYTTATESIMASYEKAGRRINVLRDEEDDLVVSNA